MIFGKTNEEKFKIKQNNILKKINGIKKYAWFPIILFNGQWAWLVTYYTYYDGCQYENKIMCLCSGSSDTYLPIKRNYLFKNSEFIKLSTI